ncbi:MAG: hypothetical protein U0175_07005 [Caldilineaceae bacterium]
MRQPPPQPERASPTKDDEITVCSTNLWVLGEEVLLNIPTRWTLTRS